MARATIRRLDLSGEAISEIGWCERHVGSTFMVMMTLAIHDQRLAKPGPQNAALRDYDSVRRAIASIGGCRRQCSEMKAIARRTES